MKKTYGFWFFFVTSLLCLVSSTQSVFASDALFIAPTRLEFDAKQAPKNCNEEQSFTTILENWVPRETLRTDAERTLVVRIHRAPTGDKLVYVMLVDAAGTTLKEHHQRFFIKTECYKVLYESAYAAATLMGAFEKPPAPEPLVCPALPALPALPVPPEPARLPIATLPCPRLTVSAPVRSAIQTPTSRRVFIGAGVFLGMTTKPEASVGPSLSLGFVPFSHWPGFQIEFDGAWVSSKTQQWSRFDRVPLFGSVCHSHHGLRLCSGLVTTLLSSEHPKDARDFMLAASLRIGTELNVAGPLSIRFDVFALLPLSQRTFGHALAAFDTANLLAAGTTAMAIWSLD